MRQNGRQALVLRPVQCRRQDQATEGRNADVSRVASGIRSRIFFSRRIHPNGYWMSERPSLRSLDLGESRRKQRRDFTRIVFRAWLEMNWAVPGQSGQVVR